MVRPMQLDESTGNPMQEPSPAYSQIQTERLFELSLELLCVIGFDGCIMAVNPAVTRVLGYSQRDVIGRPALELVHPDDRARLEEKFGELIQGRQITSF